MSAVHFDRPELASDAAAIRVVKDEVVRVEFATQRGELLSAVGPNVFAAGDALVTGTTGDRWSVSRERFDARYRPEPPTRHGQAGQYRSIPVPVLARRVAVSFTVARSAGGDVLRGEPGDWLVEYAPADHGVVARARFDSVYRRI